MKYIVILNEKAGIAGRAAPEVAPTALREAFAHAGVDAEISVVPPARIQAALQTAVAARPEAVVIGGGDGSVRCAAAALADSGIALGVLPLGTLNHFAKDLAIPPTIADAIVTLAAGFVREVDVAEVNGHVFVNNCSLGSYAEAVRRRDALRATEHGGKWWAMLRASLTVFRRLRRMRLQIAVAGASPRAVRTPVVVVANNRYSGHVLHKSLRARLDKGQLWLYTAHVHHHLAVVHMMFQSLVRRIDAADALAAEPARDLVITSERGAVPVAADGEIVELHCPLRFRIRPRALRVLAPDPQKKPAA